MKQKTSTSGFTLIEMIVTVIIVMIVMSSATTFFVNFISSQVKGVSYINVLNENMIDMQFLVRKVKQASFIAEVGDNEQKSLLIRNNQKELGPYSLVSKTLNYDELNPELDNYYLAVKDFFVYNDLDYDSVNNVLYYTDTGNHVIRSFNLNTQENKIVAGVYQQTDVNELEEGPVALLNNPMGVALTADGIYVADSGHHLIKKINPNGLVEIIAGTKIPGYNETENNKIATQNQINYPTDLEIAADGSIYFSDTGNNRIRKIDLSGNISTIAGTGKFDYTVESGNALLADLNIPIGLALDQDNLYFCDTYNSRVGKINLGTGELQNISGGGERLYGGDDGYAANASFNFPSGLSLKNNNLYITDSLNHIIRKIEPGRDQILGNADDKIRIVTGFTGRTYIGPGNDIVETDDDVYKHFNQPRAGLIESASGSQVLSSQSLMNNPSGIISDEENNLYFIDSLNNRIRKIENEELLFTVLKNDLNVEVVLKNIDFNSFVYDGVNDYVGGNLVKKLTFDVPELIKKNIQPYVEIDLELVGIDLRDDTEVSSRLQTTVTMRRWER